MPDNLPPDIDDPTIPDSELLYRRIRALPDNIQLVAPGQYRPASGRLKDTRGPLSVDLGSLSTPEQTRNRADPRSFHVAAFTALAARKVGCRIVRDPQPNEPAHALIFGDHQARNGALVDNKQSRRIAYEARIVLFAEGFTPPS